jgi:hypothetical protein
MRCAAVLPRLALLLSFALAFGLESGENQMIRLAACLGVAAALCLTGGSVNAEGRDGEKACKGDVYRFCSEAIPSEEKIVACMKKNRKRLSKACRQVMSGGKAEPKKHKSRKSRKTSVED